MFSFMWYVLFGISVMVAIIQVESAKILIFQQLESVICCHYPP